MTDWIGVLISTGAGLAGAGIGGYAAWKAACKAGDDARRLAVEERRADVAEQAAERVRSAARSTREVVVGSMLKFANIGHVQTSGFDAETEAKLIAGAELVRDDIVNALHRYGYLLPREAREYLDALFHLIVEATHVDIGSKGIDHNRLTRDVQGYAQFVRLVLEAIECDTDPLPSQAVPIITRVDAEPWRPEPLPAGWWS